MRWFSLKKVKKQLETKKGEQNPPAPCLHKYSTGTARRTGRPAHDRFQAHSRKTDILGQEVLERTACEIENGNLTVRLEVGFPANGRTINAPELKKILFDYLPEMVKKSLYYKNLRTDEVKKVLELSVPSPAI